MALVGQAGGTTREPIFRVSPEYFATLGIGPARGRTFTEEETTPGADAVVIVTDGYWRHVLGADPDVLERRITVEGSEKQVVGVLPPEFSFLSSRARLFLPLASAPDQRGAGRRHWGSQAQMIARLAPGASLAQAQAALDAHNAAMEQTNPDAGAMAAAGFRSLAVPLGADHVAEVRPTLLLVQAGALVLLLIGTVNLANLLLIRAARRVRELAVRHAIGASRAHIVGEVIVESMVLAGLGGLLGVGVGTAGVELLKRLGADRLPLAAQVAFDGRAVMTALCGVVLLGLAMAVPLIWYNLRAQAAGAAHLHSKFETASRRVQRLRHGFVVAQVALGFVLLSSATLLGLSLHRVTSLPPGFRPDNVLSGQLSLPWSRYDTASSRLAFLDRLSDAIARQPGVTAAGKVTNVPLSGNSVRSAATVRGRTRREGEPPHAIYSYGVAGDYMAAMGFPLREGRFLTQADSRAGARVCVVDEAFARRSFPDGQALGQRLFMGGGERPDDEAFTIVGVVGAVKQAALTEDGTQGAVYYPYAHRAENEIYVVMRTSVPAATLGAVLRRIAGTLDEEVAVSDVRSMEGRIEDSLLVRRSPALIAAMFSGIALLLATLGTYGVLSHAVTLRRREIALRIALGARPDQVRAQFARLAVRLVGAGTAIGVAGAYVTGRAMQGILFDMPPLHVPALAATAAIMAVVALGACLVPSRRAALTSPVELLGDE